MGSISGSGRSPGAGNGTPPTYFPGKFHRQKNLAGYSPWGCRESDMNENVCAPPNPPPHRSLCARPTYAPPSLRTLINELISMNITFILGTLLLISGKASVQRICALLPSPSVLKIPRTKSVMKIIILLS